MNILNALYLTNKKSLKLIISISSELKFSLSNVLISGSILMLLYQYASSKDMFEIRIFSSILLFIVMFKLNQYESFGVFLLLLPVQRIVVLINGGNSLIFYMGLIILLKQIYNDKLYCNKIHLIQFSIIIIYSLAIVLITLNFYPFIVVIKIIPIFILNYQLIYKSVGRMKDYFYKMVTCLTCGVIFSGVTSLIVNGYDGERLNPGNGSSNFYGAIVAYCLAQILVIRLNKGKNKYLISSILIISILLLFGLLTQSRSFIFVVIFMICWFILYHISSKKVVMRLLIVISVIICFILLTTDTLNRINYAVSTFDKKINSLKINQPSDNIVDRVTSDTVVRVAKPRNNDITNGRSEIWSIYIKKLVENPKWLWFGGVDYTKINAFVQGQTMVAHNFIIEQICMYGIIGNIIIIVMFIIYWRSVKKCINNNLKLKNKMFNYLPLIVMLITSFTGHAILNLVFINQFFLSAIAVNITYLNRNYIMNYLNHK